MNRSNASHTTPDQIIQPLATWFIATSLFGLSGPEVTIAVVLAALPTSTGPFMLAELYNRQQQSAASTLLVTTVLSVATLPLVLVAL